MVGIARAGFKVEMRVEALRVRVLGMDQDGPGSDRVGGLCGA